MSKIKQSVAKVWFAKPKEAWYNLSKNEQAEFFSKEQALAKELRKKYGIRSLITTKCHWSNEEWLEFGVEEFPDIESLQEYNEKLSELGMYRYFEAKVFLGTPIEE